jgi:pimeloyl-ACP methyl ester carboxylesterase
MSTSARWSADPPLHSTRKSVASSFVASPRAWRRAWDRRRTVSCLFPISQAERTAAVANARLRVFDGAGHFPPHERPTEVAREIAEFAATVS